MKEMDKYYDEQYYKSHCGDEYQHGKGWEEIFSNYANHIIKEIDPKKTLDVGCAVGFLVEALADRGVDAYGIDISEYAINNVREDMKARCKVKSALDPITEKYDLITCIEVLEHLESKDIPLAIQRLCEATEDIIFSSTPFDYEEESHISVHAPEYWAAQFAYNGFYHDVNYDCSYIAVQTMRFRKSEKNKVELIMGYERELFQKHQEIVAVRHQLKLSDENVKIYKDAYQKHVDMINDELNPKINELNAKLIDKEANMQAQIVDICKKQEDEQSERIETLKKQYEQKYQNKINEEIVNRKRIEQNYYIEKELVKQVEQQLSDCIEKNNYEKRMKEEVERQLSECVEKSNYESKMRGELEQQLDLSRNNVCYERKLREEVEHKLWTVEQESEHKLQKVTEESWQKCNSIDLLNQKIRETNNLLLNELNLLRDNEDIHFKNVIKKRRKKRLIDKELMKKDKEYWKPVFDAVFYAQHNEDIYNVYGNNTDELLRHFICHGMSEGRRANADFDITVYMLYNPDIVRVCKLDKRAYYLHYIENGKKEQRTAAECKHIL